MGKRGALPRRWAFKHGAFYYRPRKSELALFDGKSWYRLGTDYPTALRAFADKKELEAENKLSWAIDRYELEVLPTFKPNTQESYSASLRRLRLALGHNRFSQIEPMIVYQYLDAVAESRTMNVANNDLKVLNNVLNRAVRWGAIRANPVKSEVKYYGIRDGVKVARTRLVEDWELDEWKKVASPVQLAFAAIALLTGARKTDILRITLDDDRGDILRILNHKTGKESLFRMTAALREAITMARDTRVGSSEFLFTGPRGAGLVKNDRSERFDQNWRESMQRAIAETALKEPFTRHDLRAKVGSEAEDDARAQALLNHSSVEMTRTHYRRRKAIIDPVR